MLFLPAGFGRWWAHRQHRAEQLRLLLPIKGCLSNRLGEAVFPVYCSCWDQRWNENHRIMKQEIWWDPREILCLIFNWRNSGFEQFIDFSKVTQLILANQNQTLLLLTSTPVLCWISFLVHWCPNLSITRAGMANLKVCLVTKPVEERSDQARVNGGGSIGTAHQKDKNSG